MTKTKTKTVSTPQCPWLEQTTSHLLEQKDKKYIEKSRQKDKYTKRRNKASFGPIYGQRFRKKWDNIVYNILHIAACCQNCGPWCRISVADLWFLYFAIFLTDVDANSRRGLCHTKPAADELIMPFLLCPPYASRQANFFSHFQCNLSSDSFVSACNGMFLKSWQWNRSSWKLPISTIPLVTVFRHFYGKCSKLNVADRIIAIASLQPFFLQFCLSYYVITSLCFNYFVLIAMRISISRIWIFQHFIKWLCARNSLKYI